MNHRRTERSMRHPSCRIPRWTVVVAVSFVAAAAASAAISPAGAQALVLGSDSASLRPGRIIDKGETVKIPKGASVRVMLPSGETRSLKGPQDLTTDSLAGSAPTDTQLWDSVAAYVTTPPPEEEAFTRGLAAASTSPDRLPFSWRSVPLTAEGDICVEKGAALSLVRGSAATDASVTIIDVQGGGRRAEARFAKGQAKAPWPDALAIKIGTFAITEAGAPPRQFRMRVIAPLPPANEAIRVLHGQRCEAQRNALIDALRDPAFDPAKAR